MIIRVKVSGLPIIIGVDIRSQSVAAKLYVTTNNPKYLDLDASEKNDTITVDELPVLSKKQFDALLFEETRGWISRRINDEEQLKHLRQSMTPEEAFLAPMME